MRQYRVVVVVVVVVDLEQPEATGGPTVTMMMIE
jgi:hypothetical protein